ncbi:PD-(D/E)XK nuclease family protein [Vibrio breoganii]|uniref:PD-(D/E)XK nuclease family protein n=1 Tax=Vibrio breoganii TaxID=553239 RepID=UPI000C8225D2|nr:PD-(D/E)XK nuclease family protein [Vibrio breoganii]PMO81122.1 hypothetical protein BCT00_12305 [Vibrio breoganii]
MYTSIFDKYTQLLQQAQDLPCTPRSESSVFSIGSKGYFENPTTDILAFFCDDNAEHGLGSLVLSSLIECLPDNLQGIDHSLSSTPEREVVTQSGKRIDLLLESEQWVVVLENKINNGLDNPFEAYEAFFYSENPDRFAKKEPIFLVLSRTGKPPKKNNKWLGVSYPDLIHAIKYRLSDYFITQPLNKWVILLREFILHLEGVMTMPTTSEKTINFVLDNLANIQELQALKKNAINDYHQSLQQQVQNHFSQTVKIRLHHWNQYPALRFALDSWGNSESDVVLYLDGNDKGITKVNCYAHITVSDHLTLADEHLALGSHDTPWDESGGKYRCFNYFIKDASNESIIELLIKKLSTLNTFEQQVRPNMEG